MKRDRDEAEEEGNEERNKRKMEIVWQTPAHPAQKQDYVFHNGKLNVSFHKINSFFFIRLTKKKFRSSNFWREFDREASCTTLLL